MTPDILAIDPTTNQWRLQLQRGKWAGRSWRVRMRVCPNPLCGCGSMDFEAAPAGTDDPTAVARFSLDPTLREITEKPDDAPDPDSEDLAEAAQEEFTDEDWLRLVAHLFAEKRQLYARMDVTKLNYDFRPELFSGAETNAGYAEVFPFAEGFPFELDGEKWIADDQYCVIPDCGCRDAGLTFLHIVKTAPGRAEVSGPPPIARYDYTTCTFETLEKSRRGQPPLTTLVAAVRAAHSAFDNDLKLRHTQLKILYARALRKKQPAAIATTVMPDEPRKPAKVKLGRNDPCPCGSGKKYKRCCGG